MPTAPPPSNDLPQPSRFIVGIDLGTTNSAVGYVDTDREPWRVETFRVPQLVDVGQVETLETLPSFHYQPVADEATAAGLRLPWSREAPPYTVGVFAREQGSRAPGRLIASAKSWLCHSGVDRTADLLPWQGAA
nr:molecular chaperone Hsp70 [Pirellulaceae bacterium]